MVVPDFQSFMLPLLNLAADRKEHSQSEANDALSQILANNRDKIERQVDGQAQDEISFLNPILEELAKEGRIKMHADLVSIINR